MVFLFFAYAALFANGTLSSSSSLLLTINAAAAVFFLFLIGASKGWPGGTYDGGSVIAGIRIGECCWDAVAVSIKCSKSVKTIFGGEPSSSVVCK